MKARCKKRVCMNLLSYEVSFDSSASGDALDVALSSVLLLSSEQFVHCDICLLRVSRGIRIFLRRPLRNRTLIPRSRQRHGSPLHGHHWLIGQLFVKIRPPCGELSQDELIQHYYVVLPLARRWFVLSFIRRVAHQTRPESFACLIGTIPLVHVLAWRFAQGIQLSVSANIFAADCV